MILLQSPPPTADSPFVQPSRRPLIFAALAVLALCLAIRCCVLATLYDGDMELFVYMGKLAGQGGRVGIELIDNKLPTVGLLMWAPYQLIGAWWPGYALLGVGGAIVAVIAIARAAAEVNRSSLWPTAAMAAAWTTFPLAVFSAFKLEHISLPCSCLAAWAFVRCWRTQQLRYAAMIGLLAGVGALAKPNALAVLAAAGIALLAWSATSWRVRLKILAAMAAGLAVPATITLIYLVRSGAIAALPSVYEQIRLYNQNSVWQPATVLAKAATVAALLGVPLLMRGVLERRSRELAPVDASVVVRFALLWLLLEIGGISMQGRMYGYHFLPVTAPAALLFGLIPRRPRAITLIGSTAPVMCASALWAWAAMLATPVPQPRLAAIRYVEMHAAPGDGVWMDECARVLVESDLKAGSRVPLTFLFSNDDGAPARFGGMIQTDIAARRPRFVVLPPDCVAYAKWLRDTRIEFNTSPARGDGMQHAWAGIEAMVKSNYTPVATFGDERVYERGDAVVRSTDEALTPNESVAGRSGAMIEIIDHR